MTTTAAPRRFGVKRWIILALFILGGVLAFGVGGIFKPVAPAVVIPGEKVWPTLAIPITNTMVATLLADLERQRLDVGVVGLGSAAEQAGETEQGNQCGASHASKMTPDRAK